MGLWVFISLTDISWRTCLSSTRNSWLVGIWEVSSSLLIKSSCNAYLVDCQQEIQYRSLSSANTVLPGYRSLQLGIGQFVQESSDIILPLIVLDFIHSWYTERFWDHGHVTLTRINCMQHQALRLSIHPLPYLCSPFCLYEHLLPWVYT